jgi:hypothetical protein
MGNEHDLNEQEHSRFAPQGYIECEMANQMMVPR